MIAVHARAASLGLIAATLTGAPTLADNTDTATVTVRGRVLAPLEILTSDGNIDFPDVVAPVGGAVATKRLSCRNGEGCASFEVRGQAGFAYKIAVSEPRGVSPGVLFTPQCGTPSGRSVGVVGRTAEIRCGGRLDVASNAEGAFVTSFVVSVTYD